MKSGVLHLNLTITPHNSSAIAGKIVLSASGPFQSEGLAKLPDLDLTLGFQAEGVQGSLQLISTGGNAYVEVGGTAYMIPNRDVRQLESSMSSGAAHAVPSASGEFKKLGIDPRSWITSAKVVGQEQVYGTQTNHIHADVDTATMVQQISGLLSDPAKLRAAGAATTGTLPKVTPAIQSEIVKVLGTPTLDIWSGVGDHIFRKLAVNASLTVPASARRSLDGMTSADIAFTLGISDLNQPQTVTAPAHPQPWSGLKSQLGSLLGSFGGLGSSSLGGGTGTSTSSMGA